MDKLQKIQDLLNAICLFRGMLHVPTMNMFTLRVLGKNRSLKYILCRKAITFGKKARQGRSIQKEH